LRVFEVGRHAVFIHKQTSKKKRLTFFNFSEQIRLFVVTVVTIWGLFSFIS